MLRRLFIDHPASAGESYSEHLGQAARFSAAMFVGALACLVHAVVPALCKCTGSGIIRDLNDRMVTNRTAAHPSAK